VGLIVGALFGAKQVDVEKVLSYFPLERVSNSPVLRGEMKKECPCKAAKEHCIADEGGKIFTGKCKMLWQECGAKKKVGWEACTLAKKRCPNNKEGLCLSLWEKCGEERKAHMKKRGDRAWWACRVSKTKCMKDGQKVMDGRCGFIWKKCGEEMKAHSGAKKEWWACKSAKTKCMKDGEKVEDGKCGYVWKKCGEEMKAHSGEKKEWVACKAAKTTCVKDGEKVLDGKCGLQWEKCGEEMKAHSGGKKEWWACKAGKTKCFKDGEKVMDGRCGFIWKKCGEEMKAHSGAKKDQWACKAGKTRCFKDGKKVMDGRCGFIWQKCGEEMKQHSGNDKEWFFCKGAKQNCLKDGEKVVDGKCGIYWSKCDEEVKEHEKKVDTNDCYFDKECHKLVDWGKIGKVKRGIMSRLKFYQADEAKMKFVMTRAHQLFKDAGMPEDRIDYILKKWSKYAATHKSKPSGAWRACTIAKTKCMKEGQKVVDGRCGFIWRKCGEEVKEHAGEKKEGDTKDCYFDKECHKLVDWDKIGKVKDGIMGRMKMFQGDDVKMKALITHAQQLFKDAGMPEDRINYILKKWETYAAGEKKKEADTKDCYFDKECHKLVDWDKIGKVKAGVMARMKMFQGDDVKMHGLITHAQQLFKDAGMPENRIDYILKKWAKYAAGEKP